MNENMAYMHKVSEDGRYRSHQIMVPRELLDDSSFDITGLLHRTMDDSMTIARHRAEGTHPRICDMRTARGRTQAWELFFENGLNTRPHTSRNATPMDIAVLRLRKRWTEITKQVIKGFDVIVDELHEYARSDVTLTRAAARETHFQASAPDDPEGGATVSPC